MEALIRFITTRRKLVVTIFLVAAALCGLMSLGVSVNYNMVDYLPADAQSTVALEKMNEEFTESVPNIRVMVRDVDLMEALAWKAEIAGIEGITAVMWLDDVIDVKTPIELADSGTVESYYKEENALFSVTAKEEQEVEVVEALYELLGERGAIDGEAVTTASAQMMASNEAMGAMFILIPLIILILLLTSSSWVEPVLFLGAIGVAVVLNMGTNLFLGEVSNITTSISPILQMAVSLDYAIFLLHRFEENRQTQKDVEQAMQRAIRASFPAIASSAATTLFGFLSLMFMKFRLGSDLGLNLVKGIVFSYIAVMIFMPALTLCFYKIIDKTKHRKFIPEFPKIGKRILKIRIPALVLILLLVVPCFMAQQRTGFIYGMGEPEADSTLGKDTAAINEVFGESMVMVVLVPAGDAAREEQLGNDLNDLDHVTSVVFYATTVGTSIPEEYLDETITANFYSEHFARVIVYADTQSEGEVAFTLVEQVRATTAAYYEEYYTCGQSANLYDMKAVITEDNLRVNLIAIAAIALVLLITFKSLALPPLLVFIIESAIWINLSVPYFTGTSLSYIGYLVINTVQLGATIDYAILLSDNYIHNRGKYRSRMAMEETLRHNFIPILTSAMILTLAGLTLSITSSNSIVAEMGTLLARGTILSFSAVLCALPGVLLLADKVIAKTTFGITFYETDKEEK